MTVSLPFHPIPPDLLSTWYPHDIMNIFFHPIRFMSGDI
jgi:hypothetical protein